MRPQTNSPSSEKATISGPVAAPRDVRASFVLWLAAVGAGVFETILAIIEAVSGHLAAGTEGVVVGVSIRLLVFSAVVLVALLMLRGKRLRRGL